MTHDGLSEASCLVSAVLVLLCGQTDRHTQINADERFTSAAVVGVSNVKVEVLCGLSYNYYSFDFDCNYLFYSIHSNVV